MPSPAELGVLGTSGSPTDASPVLLHRAVVSAPLRAADLAFLQIVTEAAPDGLLVADAGGRIVVVNGQVETLFGYLRDELVGRPIELLVPERFRGGHIVHTQAFTRRPSRRPMGGGLDLWGRRKDGSEFPIEISLSPVTTDDGLFAIAAIRDITDRMNLEEDRRRAEERYRLLAEHSHDIVFRVRLTPSPWRVEYMSPAVTQISGYTPEDHYANPNLLLDEVHPDDRQLMERLLQEPRTVPMPLLLRAVHRDGAVAWHELNCSVVEDPSGRATAMEGMARDVTLRVESEIERQRLALATALEQDRDRIARDLHDGVMQTLYAAGLNLQSIMSAVSSDTDAGVTLVDTLRMLQDTIADIRTYVMDLRSDQLPSALAAELRAPGEFAVEVELPERWPELTQQQHTALSHILREAVNNVRKHAHARHVRIVVRVGEGALELLVEDDGQGFDTAELHGAEHLGLGNIAARAQAIGASLLLESESGHGTRLRCTLPV